MGGRDGWYLWAIVICSLIFPFIKIETFIIKHKKFSFLITAIIFICANVLRMLYGWEPFVAVWVLVCGVSSYSLWILFQDNKNSKKNIWLWLSSIAILFASFAFTFFRREGMIISPISMTVFVIACSTLKYQTPKWMNIIVRNSYYIYETHFIFQSLYALYLKEHYHQSMLVNGNTTVYFENAKQYWECFGFVFGCSLGTSIVLSQLQFNIWEKYIAKKIFYIHKPLSKEWWIIILIFAILFWTNFIFK